MPAIVVMLLGKEWPVRPPTGASGFTVAEEWMAVATDADQSPNLGLRVAAAALGFCTDVAKGVSFERHKYNVLEYGGEVYGLLRKAGATPQEIAAAASPCYQLLSGLVLPREVEVADKVNFSSGGGGSTP